MQIRKLNLKNFRGIYQSSLTFRPGVNLLVGENGVGKTAVLDAIRISLSQVFPKMTPATKYNLGFRDEDIMAGRGSMHLAIEFECHDIVFDYNINKNREKWINVEGDSIREQTIDTPDKSILNPSARPDDKKKTNQPIFVYFSVKRSHASDQKSKATEGQQAAYSRALLEDRGVRVKDLADWWKIKDAVAKEAPDGSSSRQLENMKQVLHKLLPEFADWKRKNGDIFVTKQVEYQVGSETRKEEILLKISQLSEGERSLISFAFDLARRLSQANPKSENPAIEGTGVVLIDEIDLHLHPAWQRVITHTLAEVFPQLQFIATTHSPQIIGEVVPENVLLIAAGGQCLPVTESLGRDSGWILRHIMETEERTAPMVEGLNEIKELIKSGRLNEAKDKVNELRTEFGPDPELAGADSAIDRRLLFKK